MTNTEGGSPWELVHTQNGVRYVDWSPSGRFVVYSSAFVTSFEPPAIDSAGLHVVDLWTGVNTVLRASGPERTYPVYFGRHPRWSRDEKRIAFLEARVDGYDLVLVGRDGSDPARLARSPSGTVYDDLQWFVRPSAGLEGLVYSQLNGPGRGTHFINRDGSGGGMFERPIGIHDAFSPDGEFIVTSGIDESDTAEVLFVERVGDPFGTSRRQLTVWDRPAGGDASSKGATRHSVSRMSWRRGPTTGED